MPGIPREVAEEIAAVAGNRARATAWPHEDRLAAQVATRAASRPVYLARRSPRLACESARRASLCDRLIERLRTERWPSDDRSTTRETTAPVEQDIVVITGMSGAGRSEAIHTFEDLGYFCIDNLPPAFIAQLVEAHRAARQPRPPRSRSSATCAATSSSTSSPASSTELERAGIRSACCSSRRTTRRSCNRFKETRRRHPLCDEGGRWPRASRAEREALATGPRARRHHHRHDATLAPAAAARAHPRAVHRRGPLARTLAVTVSSFGFKYGLPIDADIVMDVRFLPNPYYDRRAARPSPGSTRRCASSCSAAPRRRRSSARGSTLLDTC